MSKIKKYTKKLRKKLDKKNIDVKETDVMELKKLRNKAKVLTDSRIKKMDRLEEENLQTIKDLLLKNKRSAYQEKNIDRIVKFIKNN